MHHFSELKVVAFSHFAWNDGRKETNSSLGTSLPNGNFAPFIIIYSKFPFFGGLKTSKTNGIKIKIGFFRDPIRKVDIEIRYFLISELRSLGSKNGAFDRLLLGRPPHLDFQRGGNVKADLDSRRRDRKTHVRNSLPKSPSGPLKAVNGTKVASKTRKLLSTVID